MLDDAELIVIDDLRPHEREDRLIDGQIHDLTATTIVSTGFERGERQKCASETGRGVCHGETRKQRGSIGETVGIRETRHGFGERAEARALAIRSSLTEARYAHEHEARIDRGEGIITEPPLLQRARPKILDDYIRALCEPPDDVHTQRRAEIG